MLKKLVVAILLASIIALAPARSAHADDTGTDIGIVAGVVGGLTLVSIIVMSVEMSNMHFEGHVKNEHDPHLSETAVAENAVNSSIQQAFSSPNETRPHEEKTVADAGVRKAVVAPGIGYDPNSRALTGGVAGIF